MNRVSFVDNLIHECTNAATELDFEHIAVLHDDVRLEERADASRCALFDHHSQSRAKTLERKKGLCTHGENDRTLLERGALGEEADDLSHAKDEIRRRAILELSPIEPTLNTHGRFGLSWVAIGQRRGGHDAWTDRTGQ